MLWKLNPKGVLVILKNSIFFSFLIRPHIWNLIRRKTLCMYLNMFNSLETVYLSLGILISEWERHWAFLKFILPSTNPQTLFPLLKNNNKLPLSVPTLPLSLPLHHLALPMTSSAHWRHCPSLIRHLSSEICLCWIIFHEHRGCLFRSSLRDHVHTKALDQREVKQPKGWARLQMTKLIRSIRWKCPICAKLLVKWAWEGRGLLEMQMFIQTSQFSPRDRA